MTPRLGLYVLAAVFVGVLVYGFIQDPFGWRKAKIDRLEGEVTQGRADTAIGHSAAQTAAAVRGIIEAGQKEQVIVQAIPGAETPIEPVRRAAVCGSLARVFNDPNVCEGEPDGNAAVAVSDAPQ